MTAEKDGRLTTHVLDTAAGRPAAGLKIELWSLAAGRTLLRTATTNSDGRTDGPLLAGDAFQPGHYELVFHAGDYLRAQFREQNLKADGPLFLDVIPIRFGIAARGQHYHVPLLLSPFGYSTYRGS
jgi:5-hydroxyisourate hydrolase